MISVSAGLLTEEFVDRYLRFNNSGWDSDEDGHWTHSCLPHCEFGCRGDPAKSLAVMLDLLVEFIGSAPVIALLYRYKHVDTANAWCMRLQKNEIFYQGALTPCTRRLRVNAL